MITLGDVVSSGDVFSLSGRIGGTPKLEKAFNGYALVVEVKKRSKGKFFKNCKLLMPDGSVKYINDNHLKFVLGIENEKC